MRHAPKSHRNPSSTSRAAADVVQMAIGKKGHNKKVIHVKTRKVYFAESTGKGSGRYKLSYRRNGKKVAVSGAVSAIDPDYELYKEPTLDFSIRSDQKNRRVYTTVPPTEDTRDETVFHGQGSGKERDFSYTHVSEAFHRARKKPKLSQEDADEAISTGANIPLKDGSVPLDDEQDKDLQLVPLHLLHYQHFHTPDNLKSASRVQENPWRKKELDQSRSLLDKLGTEGLKLILPEVTNEKKASRLQDIFPGFLDVSFPPDQTKTLFSYDNNKAVYLLNRKLRLQAFLERKKKKNAKVSRRKLETQAFLDTIGEQDGSTIKDPADYLEKVLSLRQDSDEESFDEASSDEEGELQVFNPKDNLQTAENRRRTFLNTLGTHIKWLNTKILLDLARISRLENEEEEEGNEGELKRARAALKKHRRILARLQRKHDRVFVNRGQSFKRIQQLEKSYVAKRKLLEKAEPTGKEPRKKWQKIKKELDEDYSKGTVGSHLKRKGGFLPGVGKKTLENMLKEKEKPKKKRGGVKRKRTSSSSEEG